MSKKIIYTPFIEESKESLSEDEEDGDEDVEPITEFRFVPSDKSACECSVILIFSLCSVPIDTPLSPSLWSPPSCGLIFILASVQALGVGAYSVTNIGYSRSIVASMAPALLW